MDYDISFTHHRHPIPKGYYFNGFFIFLNTFPTDYSNPFTIEAPSGTKHLIPHPPIDYFSFDALGFRSSVFFSLMT